jgi:transcriptional regulator with XRE-family HTH domain
MKIDAAQTTISENDPQTALGEYDPNSVTQELGSEIRRVRAQRGLTLTDLSETTGLSVSMLSMLERGKTGVSVGSVVAVASALGIQVGELFHTASAGDPNLTRRAEQVEITIGSGVVRRLIMQDRDHGIEMTMLKLPPGTHTGTEPVRHEGHEYVTVLDGVLTVEIAQETYELKAGDAIHLDAERLHRFANQSANVSRLMLVVQLPQPSSYGH